MDLTPVAALVALIGVALIVTGTVVLFGPWALVACGAALVAIAVLPDWDKSS